MELKLLAKLLKKIIINERYILFASFIIFKMFPFECFILQL